MNGLFNQVPRKQIRTNNVAVRLNLSIRMVRYLAETGKLPARKVGMKIWYFDIADVEFYLIQRLALADDRVCIRGNN